MRYQAVLLDFYGTLVEEDDPIIARIVQQIAACSPLSRTAAEIGHAWWGLMSTMCAEAHGDQFRQQREIELDSLRQLLHDCHAQLDAVALSAELFPYWQAPRAYRGAGEFLARLPVPVCVVSNIDEDDLRSAIHSLGWNLPLVVTSESCRAYKPRPELFAAAVRRLGVHPDKVLHVGDSLTADVEGAQRFGLDVAWLNRRGRPLPLHLPTYVALDFDDLLAQIGA
jgi:2-haloacid dehalogenase/putative hydrolase of the HAD superfamily